MASTSTLIMPLATGIALTTASVLAIGPNPTRRALAFHNRSQTLYLEIAAQPIAAGSAGSILIVPAGWSPVFSDDIRATCGWNAHMVSGSGDLTVLEWIA